jgi:hypothetical protein
LTVIAWDKKLLVADSRITSGTTLISDSFDKLFEINIFGHGKVVTGICGAIDTSGPWLAHLAEKGLLPLDLEFKGDEMGMMAMSALSVNRKGVCIEHSTEGGWHNVQYPTAIGSGADIAQHYLTQGADALTAVRAACKTNLSCGGILTSYDFTKHTFIEYSV